MKEYKVYYEIFSKKMMSTIKAYNAEDASMIVRKNLVILKTDPVGQEEEPTSKDPVVDMLRKMFGMT